MPAHTPRGLSLVELTVVIALISLLALTAAASGNTVRKRIQDNNVESSLIAAAEAQHNHHRTRGRWLTAPEGGSIKTGDITLTWGASEGEGSVSHHEDSDGSLVMAARSRSGACIAARIAQPGTTHEETHALNLGAVATCSAADTAASGRLP